jgi:hypothetical protein
MEKDVPNCQNLGRGKNIMSKLYAPLILALCLTGCASNDVRPPSPARDLNNLEMLAMPTPPNERYYVMIFASQSTPKIPRFTHCWATVVKATDQPDGAPPKIESHTISWYPATMRVKPWHIWVEDGINLGLHDTINVVQKHHERVSMWGPYETWHGLYRRFLVQKQFMESGEVGYQCVDTIGEAPKDGAGCDCIHAMSDMDPIFDRRRYPLTFFGEAASRNIVRQVRERPILIHPDQTHDWLIPALGLDCYPIIRRQETGPSEEFSPENVQAYMQRAGAAPSSRGRLLR